MNRIVLSEMRRLNLRWIDLISNGFTAIEAEELVCGKLAMSQDIRAKMLKVFDEKFVESYCEDEN